MKKIFLTLLFSVLTAHATETIRVIVPYAAGGNTDLVARLYAKELAKQGIDVVVINRPGANGFIGTQEIMNARPDGKTLLFTARWAGKLVALDIEKKTITQQVPVGKSPHGVWTLNHASRLEAFAGLRAVVVCDCLVRFASLVCRDPCV